MTVIIGLWNKHLSYGNGCDWDCRFYIIIQSLIMDHMDGHDAFSVWLILIMFIKWNVIIFNLFLHDYVEQTLEGL